MRPDVTAGPIERNLRPENTADPIGSGVGVGVGDWIGVGLGGTDTIVLFVESPLGVGDGVVAGVDAWPKNVDTDDNVRQTRTKNRRD